MVFPASHITRQFVQIWLKFPVVLHAHNLINVPHLNTTTVEVFSPICHGMVMVSSQSFYSSFEMVINGELFEIGVLMHKLYLLFPKFWNNCWLRFLLHPLKFLSSALNGSICLLRAIHPMLVGLCLNQLAVPKSIQIS